MTAQLEAGDVSQETQWSVEQHRRSIELNVKGVWHSGLKCCFCAAVVRDGEVDIYLPPQNCTDMNGAIRFAQQLVPNVKVIRTIAGGGYDTTYLCKDRHWESRR